MNDDRHHAYDDEIDLRDILKIIWKEKLIIIIGTILSVLMGIGANTVLPEVHRASMVLKPGILEVNQDNNKTIYVDSPKNIKAAIELGSYNSRITTALSEEILQEILSKISFAIKVPKDTDVVKISTDYANKELPVSILTALEKILVAEYQQKVQQYKTRFQIEIKSLENFINRKESEILRYQAYIDRSGAKIEELTDDVDTLVKYGQKISAEKAQVTSAKKNGFEGLIYKDFEITQNIALVRDLKEIIRNHQLSRSVELEKIKVLNSEIYDVLKDLNQLKIAENNVQNIQIIQPPELEPVPVKPKKALNIAVAFLAGAILTTILAFVKHAVQAS